MTVFPWGYVDASTATEESVRKAMDEALEVAKKNMPERLRPPGVMPERLSTEDYLPLIKEGLSQAQIAKRMGKSVGAVTNAKRTLRMRGLL